MGSFDSFFRELGPAILSLFVDKKSLIRKVRDDYVPEEGVEARRVLVEATILVSPPVPFKVERVDGDSILATDLVVYIPAKNLDDAGFVLEDETDINYHLVVDGEEHTVHNFTVFFSGDEKGLYELQLR